MKPFIGWPLIIVASAIAVELGMVGAIGAPLRPVITFWFLLVCPGMAFAQLLLIKDWVIQWTLALALSLAINVIVSEAMVLVSVWSAERALGVIVYLSLVGAAFQLLQAHRRLSRYFQNAIFRRKSYDQHS
jgi:hypothetical protein